jgi:DNA ligase-4
VDDALREFTSEKRSRSARTVWAETKYDGYRMQIHVEIRSEVDVRLTMFSKSKRNATVDRLNTHA